MPKMQNETPATLEPAERRSFSYIAGYTGIIRKLVNNNRTKKRHSSDEITVLLQVMKSNEAINACFYIYFCLNRTRGGLVCPCDDLIHIIQVAEVTHSEAKSKRLTIHC